MAPVLVAPLLMAAALLAACSPGAEYPAVLDRPEPRADAPMSPDQLKEVTNSLISDRDHLSAEAKPAAEPVAPVAQPTKQAGAPVRKRRKPAPTDSTQAAGAAPNP
jgi:hypothetical protein